MYSLNSPDGKLDESECSVTLGTQLIQLDSSQGEHHEFAYREITGVSQEGYSATIVLESLTFTFNELGDKLEDFLRNIYSLRNDQMAQDYLILEGAPILSVFPYITSDGNGSEGEVRIYKTRLGIFPRSGKMQIVRFSDITSSKFENYVATIALRGDSPNQQVELNQLGEHFDEFDRTFKKANSDLLKESNGLIREICPDIPFASLSKLSQIFTDGQVGLLKDVQSISPEFFKAFQIQLQLGTSDMYKSIDYLISSLGDATNALVGVKKLVINYLFLMIPIRGHDIVAWESNETGHATYFFKAKPSEMDQIVAGLRDVNFRREPVYLPEIELLKPEYRKYFFAAKSIPGLKFLRERFIARASHSSSDEWKSQTEGILAQSDAAKAVN